MAVSGSMGKLARGGHPLQASGMFTPSEGESPSRVFMKEGKSFIENIFKSFIPNRKVATAIAGLAFKYGLFEIDEPQGARMKYLNTTVASWGAVGGRSSFMALQGMTNIISEAITAASSGLDIRRPPNIEDKTRQEEERRNNNKRERQ